MEIPHLEKQPAFKPKFTYDYTAAEASVITPDNTLVQLKNVTLEDGEVLSVLRGTNEEDELVEIKIVDDSGKFEVIEIIIDENTVFAVTKH